MLFVKHFCLLLITGFLTVPSQQRPTQPPASERRQITIPKEGGSFITTKEASELINRFQRSHRTSGFPFSEEFNTKLIAELLQQKGATNLRIYFGENVKKYAAKKSINLILVAADDRGVDITGKILVRMNEKEIGFYPVKEVAPLTHQFQKHYARTEFPYAEKFNKRFIMSLIQKSSAVALRIYLGEAVPDRSKLSQNPKPMRMVLFAVNASGDRITKLVLQRTGAPKMRQVSNRMAMINDSNDSDSALENGQQCLNMCNINSSRLYEAQ